jgi:hypothetical protein
MDEQGRKARDRMKGREKRKKFEVEDERELHRVGRKCTKY